jgi:Protein of unknown function (DUF1207)
MKIIKFIVAAWITSLLFLLPVISEGMCGPDCCCGCQQGWPCTCDQTEYGDEDQWYYCPASLCRYAYGQLDQCGILRPMRINTFPEMNEPCCKGIWLPEEPPLFRPFMADPRQVTYSVAWRFNDNAATKNTIPVSFADSFPIYRWCGVWPWNGQLQIDLEGGLWAIFDPCYESAPLINADYYVAIPITYAIDRWQFRLRGFHISSHIGDEFLLNHPHFNRRNPSAEYLDFFISHDLTEEIRLYAGLGWVVAQDPSFKIHKLYSGVGAELRLLRWGFLDCKNILYGCPIFGMHFRGGRDFKRHIDSTFILGYEFGKLTGLYRRYRIFIEYHDGYSAEGQFSKIATNYFSVRMSYGF